MKTKKCSKCGLVKPVEEFGKDRHMKNLIRSSCKLCQSKSDKEYRKNNKEKIKKYMKKWRMGNKEKIKKYYKDWYKNNKEYHKKWQKNNVIIINSIKYHLVTTSPELKSIIEALILIRKKKTFIKEVKIG